MAALDTDTIRNGLRAFITETFFLGEEPDDFANTDSFMDKGIIDSTGVLELTGYLEMTYEFTVEDEEMLPDNLDSIDNLVGFIQRKAG